MPYQSRLELLISKRKHHHLMDIVLSYQKILIYVKKGIRVNAISAIPCCEVRRILDRPVFVLWRIT